MNCTEFECALTQAIESREHSDSSGLQAHAAGCDRCRRQWEDFAILERAIPVWKSDTPDIDLTTAVLASLAPNASNGIAHPIVRPNGEFTERADSPAARPRRSADVTQDLPSRASLLHEVRRQPVAQPSVRQSLAVLAIVAGVLLMLARFPAIEVPPSSDGSVGRQQARYEATDGSLVEQGDWRLTTGRAASADGDQADVTLTLLLREARAAYWMLAADAVGAMAEGDFLLPPVNSRRLSSGGTSDELADESLWNDGWERDFAPIGRGVGRGLGFLWDVVALDSAPTT